MSHTALSQVLTDLYSRTVEAPNLASGDPVFDLRPDSRFGPELFGQLQRLFPSVLLRHEPGQVLVFSLTELAGALIRREVVPGQVEAIARLHSEAEDTNPQDAEEVHSWAGGFFEMGGYADEARDCVCSLAAAGHQIAAVPYNWNQQMWNLPEPQRTYLLEMVRREPRAGGVHVNHHMMPHHFWRRANARANVGRVMFETDRLPDRWAEWCNQMDRIWVPSKFNRTTFAGAGVSEERLKVVPPGINTHLYDPAVAPLYEDKPADYCFLSVFDWHWRKGWDVLVKAYTEEFSADDDVALIIKTNSFLGLTHDQILAMIADQTGSLKAVKDMPRLVLHTDPLPVEQMPALYRSADCFVLPTRGEGWGRPLMEAMAMELPTIGTNWSGQQDFMTTENSFLLDYKIKPVSEEAWREVPSFRGHQWAEPDPAHLRHLMRHVFTNRSAAKATGIHARSDVVSKFSLRHTARHFADAIAHEGR